MKGSLFSFVLISFFLVLNHPAAFAIQIVGDTGGTSTYDAKLHDRYYVGADKAFIGEALDLSGVSRNNGVTDDVPPQGFVHWATMISDTYYLTSGHSFPREDEPVRFYRNDELSTDPNDYWDGNASNFLVNIPGFDIKLGQLDAMPPEWVRRYPIIKRPEGYDWLKYFDVNNIPTDVYLVGKDHAPNPLDVNAMRVGRSEIKHKYLSGFSTHESTFPIHGGKTTSGDSGGPTFTLLSEVGSALTGIHSSTNFDASISGAVDLIVNLTQGETVNVVTDQLGDMDGDYEVGAAEYSAVIANYGSSVDSISQGDLNLDGQVDSQDFSIVIAQFGSSILSPADFNKDGAMNMDDFAVIANNWQASGAPGISGDANGDGLVGVLDFELYDQAVDYNEITYPVPLIQIPGDANNNGGVNLVDILWVTDGGNYGTGIPVDPYTGGDVTGDGLVGPSDLSLVLSTEGDTFADVNGDSLVDIDDIVAIMNQGTWHTNVSNGRHDGDINEDGYVDAADLILIGEWWQFHGIVNSTGDAPPGIPEPTTLLLTLMMCIISIAHRTSVSDV